MFCSNVDIFLKKRDALIELNILVENVIFADSSVKSREQIIAENRQNWLLFLDHDCEITEETLKIAKKISDSVSKDPQNKKSFLIAGMYKNPPGAGLLQRSHNFIANTWLLQAYKCQGQRPLLLGGIFMVFASNESWQADLTVRWGAEDKLMAYHLRDAGFEFTLSEDLQVFHLTNASFKHFLKRAYLHGVNDILLISKNENRFKFSYWLREIGFANLPLVPLILLHFCIQKAAKQVQIVRQMNK